MIDLVINFDKEEDKAKLFGLLKHLKGRHAVGIKKEKQTRSLAFNRYYWSVVIPYIALETGYTKEEMHDVFRRMFLSYEKKNDITQSVDTFLISTTKLDNVEFNEYVEKIRMFAMEQLNIYVPLPNEINY
jgi:hypothetical protein